MANKPVVPDTVILVGFGSAVPSASMTYQKAIDELNEILNRESQMKYAVVRTAFTSRFFLNSPEGREQKAQSLEQVLASSTVQGVKQIYIQSLHVSAGQEFNDVQKISQAFEGLPKGIKKVYISSPLIASAEDAQKLAQVLITEEKASQDEVVLFVGHGGKADGASLSLLALQGALWNLAPNYYVVSLESEPSFDSALVFLEKMKAKKVRLVPLMTVIGDHVLNDIGGMDKAHDSAESLFAQLNAKGYQCVSVKKSLFERRTVLKLFAEKLVAVMRSTKTN
ncbi:sirohydrochlorin cobaltochelatase [Desulfovibrio litoralis]|nr:sirohydrochlorin cobaltochelatase [Desulfovibrio litoralis]